MKFWKLVSVFREQMGDLRSGLQDLHQHTQVQWLDQFTRHVREQNRPILDAEIPNDVVLALAKDLGVQFILNGTVLRRSNSTEEETISAREVVIRYGASALEEVLEKGSTDTATNR